MSIQTPEQWLASQKSGKTENKTVSTKSTAIQTPEEWLKSQPKTESKPTLGQKITNVGKTLVKSIVEPVATLALRPGQLAAETLGGMSAEQVDARTKQLFGDWVAPTPKNTSDVVKDVGRGLQTVTLATIPKIGKAADIIGGGAIAGAGSALEQGGTQTTLKDLATNTAIGAGVGTVLHGASKLIGKKAKVGEQIDTANIPTQEIPPVVKPKTVQELGQQVETSGIPVKTTNKTPIIDTSIQEPVQQPKMDIPDSVKNNIVSDLEKDYPDVTNFSRGTFKDWTDRIQQKDFNEVLDIATGKKPSPDDIPANAYYSVAKNIADETGDSRLIDELSNSNVSSKAGQELTTARLTNANNTVDIIRDIKQTLAQKIKKNNGIDVESEINKQSKVLDKLIEDVKTVKPSREMVSKILDNITC